MTFHLVNDGVSAESSKLLNKACQARDIAFQEHQAAKFVYRPDVKLETGDMLFRVARSQRAIRAEQYLYKEGVSTFYRNPLGILDRCDNILGKLDAHGVPTPQTYYINDISPETLRYYVKELGGYPLVLKVFQHASGVDVMRIDSDASLFSVLNYVASSGQVPLLSTYITPAEHWHCVVVGNTVVASYLNPIGQDGFKTQRSKEKNQIHIGADKELTDFAIKSAHVMGYDFAGIDILRHEDGNTYVLDVNITCDFSHAQTYGEIDVAGAMVDFLASKTLSKKLVDSVI